MKTIAQTGIRVGELKYVTVEAIQVGITIVWNKEKYRNVYLTNKLCEELQMYCSDNNISEGPIFCGNKKGQTITNGAVWKSLKYLAIQAGIPQELVYPHSFRHLFAKEYMQKIGDISELADLLGHTRLETTWIYTKTTSEEKRVRLVLNPNPEEIVRRLEIRRATGTRKKRDQMCAREDNVDYVGKMNDEFIKIYSNKNVININNNEDEDIKKINDWINGTVLAQSKPF